MDVEEEVGSLISSAVLMFVGALVSSGSGLIERVILARFLSQAEYGEVNLGITILFLGVTVSMVGFYQGIPRYMSRFDSQEDTRGAWYTGFIISFSSAALLSGTLLVGRRFILGNLFENPASGEILVVFIVAIPVFVGLRAGIGGIRGMEQTLYRVYTMDLLFPVGKVALIALFLWLGLDILAAGYAYLFALAVAFVVTIYLLNRLISLRGPARFHWSEMTRFSAPLMLSTIIVTLLIRTDTLMVGFFQSSADVGLYTAAYPLAQALSMVIFSFGFLYLPLASRLDAVDSHDELDQIYTLTTKWIYIVTFPAFLVFFVFPGDVLGIFFGDRYVAAAGAFAILAFGFFTNAAAGRCRETISALGYTKYNLGINATAFILNFGLNLVLIPRYSYVGAAVASASAYLATNILAIAFLKRQFDITPFSRYSLRVYALLPGVLLPVALAGSRFFSLTVFSLPVALVSVSIVSLIVVVAIGGVQAEDRILVSFVEEKIGREIPFVRKYIPESDI